MVVLLGGVWQGRPGNVTKEMHNRKNCWSGLESLKGMQYLWKEERSEAGGQWSLKYRGSFEASLCYMRLPENNIGLWRGCLDYKPSIQKIEVGVSLLCANLTYVVGSCH